MFDDNANDDLYRPLNQRKFLLEKTSLGPNGWIVEFFIHFFDPMGHNILEILEDVRTRGKIIGAINSTFLALILRSSSPKKFQVYKPISLCNILYKLICKVIARCINKVLSLHIYREQFGFLNDHQIHDAIESTQESINSIHSYKKEAVVMKTNLHKAYDSVDWSYITLILYKIGLRSHNVEWIMACITQVFFVVLVNVFLAPFSTRVEVLKRGALFPPQYLFFL